MAYIRRGVSTERYLHFQIDWAMCLRTIFQAQVPEGYIWRDDLTEGPSRHRFGGLMHGGAFFRYFTVWVNSQSESLFKVAEHSFQVPMPNSPLLLNHLCFGAHFLQEWRLTTEVFNLAFLQGCVLLTWQRGWLKTRLKKWFLLFLKKSSR